MKRWLTALVATACCGCGTICNLASSDPQVYGGPEKDIEIWSERGMPRGQNVGAFAFLGLCLADLPVSLVGDTLTLPLAIYLQQRRDASRDSRVESTALADSNEAP